MISDADNLAICLTDAPAVVELKRRFRGLDEQEEELKRAIGRGGTFSDLGLQLIDVRARKAEISRQIFGAGRVRG